MAGRRRGSPEIKDWHLWSEVTRTLTPLRPPKPNETAKLQETAPLLPAKPEVPQPGPPSSPTWSPPLPAPGAKSTPKGRVIEPRLKRRLSRGQIGIDAVIDLHGLHQEEARAALFRFVQARVARGDRTLLVITGKGLQKTWDDRFEQRGVLKTMLPLWLSHPDLSPLIAGWEAAARHHGGDGAFYVRLRRVQP